MKITNQLKEKILRQGILIEKWVCDANMDLEMESNGSQECLFKYEGKYFVLQIGWKDEVGRCYEFLPVKAGDDEFSFIDSMIENFEQKVV